MLRPGYKPPNRKVIGGTLLDQVYQEELEKCQIYLENKTVCLSIDGWSNIRNEPIICACVVNEDGNIFLVNTTDTSGNPHTSEYLTCLTLKIIQDTEKKFKCFIRSVVTDNAANMARMRLQIQRESNDVNVITYGCSAHLLNLLAKDLNVEGVMNNIVRIIKYFRNNHLAKAYLSSEGGSSLPMPIEVRWNSACDSLEAYLKNWHTLVKICEEHRNTVDMEIVKLVSNIGIKRNAEDLMARLKPISCALDLMQKENCTIARSLVIWKKLINDLNESLDSSDSTVKKRVMSRYTQAVGKYHFIAHMLSPTNIKENIRLTEEEKQEALECTAAEFPSLLPVLLRFHGKLSPYNQQVLMQDSVISNMTDIEWWMSTFSLTEIDPVAQSNIKQLMTAVASSAGVERIFSSFGLVHSDLRNRLGVEKAGKLTFLMKVLNN